MMVQKHHQKLCLLQKQKHCLATPQSTGGTGKSICTLLGWSDFKCTNKILEAFLLMNRQWRFIDTAAWAEGLREFRFNKTESRTWLGYPGSPDCTGTFCIAVLAPFYPVASALLHPELDTMWEVWPAGSQQLHVLPNTQLEVGGKTTRGCISVVGNSSWALPIKGEKPLHWCHSTNSF